MFWRQIYIDMSVLYLKFDKTCKIKAMYSPNKDLGQNFLTEKEIPRQMVEALDLPLEGHSGSTPVIIEIGAGLGAVTQILSDRVRFLKAKLMAVEIDSRFTPKLFEMYADNQNVNIIEADILNWFPENTPTTPYKVIGSLPYNITSPILHMLCKADNRPETAVIMIQKEVAQKISAHEPDASYLSSFVQTFFSVEMLFEVSRKYFSPQPNVESAVVKLTKKSDADFKKEEVRKYESFLHRAHSHPRKMLNKAFSRHELELAEIDGNLRAQNISVEKWVEFFKVLHTAI